MALWCLTDIAYLTLNQQGEGSNPSGATNLFPSSVKVARLAVNQFVVVRVHLWEPIYYSRFCITVVREPLKLEEVGQHHQRGPISVVK